MANNHDIMSWRWIFNSYFKNIISLYCSLMHSPALQIPECLQSTRPGLWCFVCPPTFLRERRAGCCRAHTQCTRVSEWTPDIWQSHPNTFWRWCFDSSRRHQQHLKLEKRTLKLHLGCCFRWIISAKWFRLKLSPVFIHFKGLKR